MLSGLSKEDAIQTALTLEEMANFIIKTDSFSDEPDHVGAIFPIIRLLVNDKIRLPPDVLVAAYRQWLEEVYYPSIDPHEPEEDYQVTQCNQFANYMKTRNDL